MPTDMARGLTTGNLVALGLPSVITQVLMPRLTSFLNRYPKAARLLTYLAALLSVLGTFTFGVRPIFDRFLWDWLPRVQIQSDDLLYRYMRQYVHAKTYPTIPNVLEVSAKGAHTSEFCDSDDEDNDRADTCDLEDVKNHGQESDITYENPSSRIFFHNGTLFIAETPWQTTGSQSLAIRSLTFSHRPLKLLLKDAWLTYGRIAREKTTPVYKSRYDSWIFTKDKTIRHLNTVDISDVQKEELIHDIAKYVSPATKAWYRKRGIPRRRGYLFHGPPGTGKSSLAAAIAGHFRVGLYTLSLSDGGINDRYLLELVNDLPVGSVLLIEDIDSCGIHRESYNSSSRSQSNVTLSGLLNALDGASAPEGHILIMSTNTPDSLDPALRRAGRVDREVEFKNASKTCAMKVFLRMMRDDDDDDTEKAADLQTKASEFAAEIPEEAVSPAEIQGYLLDNRFDIQGAITNASKWTQEMIVKRAKAKEAAEREEQSRKEQADRWKKETEAEERKEELREKALERREAAAAALEELETKTREITLKADKLRAEAEIAKYEALNGKPALEQSDALMTPADSDDEHS